MKKSRALELLTATQYATYFSWGGSTKDLQEKLNGIKTEIKLAVDENNTEMMKTQVGRIFMEFTDEEMVVLSKQGMLTQLTELVPAKIEDVFQDVIDALFDLEEELRPFPKGVLVRLRDLDQEWDRMYLRRLKCRK